MENLEILSPKIDLVFKRIFGNEKNPRILISFLNAVMDPIDKITEVKIENSNIEDDDEFSRLDIKAKTDKGERINIEIEIKNEHDMIKRGLYHWSKMYGGKVKHERYDDELVKTVYINIFNFKFFRSEQAHTCYRMKEIKTNEEFTDMQELHFIELPKIPKEDREITDIFSAWMEFIENPISNNLKKMEMEVEEIKEAKKELMRISADKKERALYEERKVLMLNKVSKLEID
ncbi:Rpn family recombination-promoting nuclease/putative transposase, partial [Bacillus cereus]|uniref:Rpn family recombination-promoting nuclease/putative transposase n=1 Tax=Bacillus cereus TaxID=1396 RepID=UPI002149C5E5